VIDREGSGDRILDIDGDGTDEVIMLRPDIESSYATQTRLRWSVVVLEPVRTAPPPELFDMDTADTHNGGGDRPPSSRLELEEILAVPIDFAPCDFDLAPRKGSVILQQWSGGVGCELGEIAKNSCGTKWVPKGPP
jgi:hypothetical protein